MSLESIITKQPIIDTPSAAALAENPQHYDERFSFHVETHVSIADLADKWAKMIRNLEMKKSVTGLIYGDTGYGKTSTAASLWRYAESRGVVAVPPFMWESMTDMLVATHGWARFRLNGRRPDLVAQLDQLYNEYMQSGLADLAARLAQENHASLETARRLVERLKELGQVSDVISASRLIAFLERTTKLLVEAGFTGLLLLPDEFELFERANSDIAKNFTQLKEFIFPLFQLEGVPLGCVVSTYNKTQAQISQRESYMLARFNKPEGSMINLEVIYGEAKEDQRFPELLWKKLAVKGNLSAEEEGAISEEVLIALGQFLAHPRSPSLISGPRSVVSTFRQAALHYQRTGAPYSIFNFCDDYLKSGIICYNQQEVDTAKAYIGIMGQGIANGNGSRQKIVQLLCVFPEGVPHDVFVRHNISDEDRTVVVQTLLGTHVITKPLGPTLLRYKASNEAGDEMIEVLKIMRDRHNSGGDPSKRAAVRAFVNHILPNLLPKRVGAAQLGWSGLDRMETDLDASWTAILTGTANEFYPDRTLTVHVGDSLHSQERGKYQYAEFYVRFVLHSKEGEGNTCEVTERGITFNFSVNHCFNPNQVPRAIGKLEDVFLPERVTPILLLDMLDFFDTEATAAQVGRLKLDAQVKMLRAQILNELMQYLFSEDVRDAALRYRSSFAQAPIGRDMVDRCLAVIIRERYPDYRSVAITHQWMNILDRYRQLLNSEQGLGVRRGLESKPAVNNDVPGMFNVSSHVTFRNTYYPEGVLRDLLRIDEVNSDGKVINARIESSNNQRSVALWFCLHPVEREVLEQLENGTNLIANRREKAIRVNEVHQAQKNKGYLDDEISQLLKVLSARGLVDEEEYQGVKHLLLRQTEISRTELERSLADIETYAGLMQQYELTPEWQPGHSPKQLRQRLDDPVGLQDEVLKDHLRRDLHDTTSEVARMIAGWVLTARNELQNLEKRIGALKVEAPKLLEQSTGHPTTDFSTVLFQDIRSHVLGLYSKQSQQIAKLQERINQQLAQALSAYGEEKTVQRGIELVAKLRQQKVAASIEEDALRQKQGQIDRLYALFQKWRDLARRTEELRLTLKDLADDEGVSALLERLDAQQMEVKRHLADRGQTVEQVLDDHEYFVTAIKTIESEFNGVTTNREERFLKYQAAIHETLKTVLAIPPATIAYNPRADAKGYQTVDLQAMNRLNDFCEQALAELRRVQTELLKPLEVFQVAAETRAAAEKLKQDVQNVETEVMEVKNALAASNVKTELQNWVLRLADARERSGDLLDRHNAIMDQLRSPRERLSEPARQLLQSIESQPNLDLTGLIISLRGRNHAGFDSTPAIISHLEELYRHNWVNIQVTTTVR